jgi:hypothetical protein
MTVAKKTTDPDFADIVAASTEKEPQPLNIVQIISRISSEAGALAPLQGKGVPFPFRGIDGTVNHLAPLLQKHGVIVIPTVLEHLVSTRELDKGRALTQSEVTVKFTFYAPDGSSLDATTVGLAQDYSDRCAAQAQSVALRVALLQTFTLPTQMPDPEEIGEQVKAQQARDNAPKPPTRTETAINKAAGAGGAGSVTGLQSQVKAAAGTKGLSGPEINALGQAISADFFTDAAALTSLVEQIKALPNKE